MQQSNEKPGEESELKLNEIKFDDALGKYSSGEVFKISSCFNSSDLEYETRNNISILIFWKGFRQNILKVFFSSKKI